jgi:glutaredoxin
LIRSLLLAVLTRPRSTHLARGTGAITAKLPLLLGGDNALALVIYTKPGCPYCQQARDYYNSKGISFIDRDAQTNKEFRAEMFKYSGGDPTVPCIVQDEKYLQSGWGNPLRG